MSTTYNGSSTGITARQAPSTTVPAETDLVTADAHNVGIKRALDFLAYLMAKAGILDTASTWTAKQTMNALDVSGALNVAGAASAGSMTVSGALAFGSMTGGIARANLPSVGQQISASCGTYQQTGNPGVSDVTNLSVSITTGGRPVVLMLVPDGTANDSILGVVGSSVTNAQGRVLLVRDSTTIGRTLLSVSGASAASVGVAGCSPSWFDAPAAGAHVYKIQVSGGTGLTVNVQYLKLLAFEL